MQSSSSSEMVQVNIQADRERSNTMFGVPADNRSHSSGSTVRRLRGGKKNLNQADSFWPGQKQIRRVFRMFDTDGSGTISYEEYKVGLKKLGFDVSNEAALMKLLREVDVDGSGQVGEEEFIRLFRMLNRETLQQKLNQGVEESGAIVTVIDFGTTLTADKVTGKIKEMPCRSKRVVHVTRFAEIIDEMNGRHNHWKKLIRWVDFVGESSLAVNALANVLDLQPGPIAAAAIDQLPRANLEEADSDHRHGTGAEGLMHFVVHLAELQNNPLKDDATRPTLVSYPAYMNNRPAVACSQLSILFRQRYKVVNTNSPKRGTTSGISATADHLVVSLRKPKTPIGKSKDVKEDGFWADVLEELEDDSQDMFFSGRKIVCALLGSVMEHNWASYDQLHAWAQLLQERVTQQGMLDDWTATQLIDCRNVSEVIERVAKDAHKMLKSVGTFPTDGSALSPTLLFLMNDESLGNRFYADPDISTLNLSPEDHALTGLIGDTDRLDTNCGSETQEIIAVTEHMESLKAQDINNTLYILTLVTVMSVPIAFFTGVYGMNFDQMQKLELKGDRDGYYIFLICAGAWLFFSIVFLLVKKGICRRCLNLD